MAQRQYTPAARGRGFNAVTVSSANISQLEAESNRILEGMRTRRDADVQNQQRLLQDMKDDANYYDKARQRDFKIADTNLDTQRKQIEYDEAVRFQRYQEASRGAAKVFENLSNLSFTAGQKAAELQKKEADEQFEASKQAGLATGGIYTSEQIAYLYKINEQNKWSDLVAENGKLAKEKGYDPNAIARLQNMTARNRTGWIYGAIQYDTATNYSSYLQKQLNNPDLTIPDPVTGQPIPYLEARKDPSLLGAVQTAIASDWLNSRGYPANSKLLNGAYQEIYKTHSVNTTLAANNQTKRLNEDTLTRYDNAAFLSWDVEGGNAFRMHDSIKGHEAAHTWFKEAATTMNPDGTFVLSDAQWQGTDVYGKGNTYSQDFKRRTIEIQNARADKLREFTANKASSDKAKYLEESQAWWAEWQKNPTPETLAAAEESFGDNMEGPPEWIQKARESLNPANAPYNKQLVTVAKDLEQRGVLTQSIVSEIYSFDPKEGNRLQEALDKQNPYAKNAAYVEQRKNVGGVTKKPSATVQFPSDTIESSRAGRLLQREFDQLVQSRAVQNGGNVSEAADWAAAEISNRIAKDATNPNGRYYREYDVITGTYKFPKLRDKPLTVSQKAKEQIQQFQDAMNNGRQKELVNTRFGVLTQTELKEELKNFNKPGYVPSAKLVLASKGVEGGLMAVLTRQAKLGGEPVPKFPESIQRVGAYSPTAQALLQRYLNAEISTRVHGFEGGRLNVGWNRHVAPAQYRESIEKHSKTFGMAPALIAAQLEVESTWDPNAGSKEGARGLGQFMPDTARQYGVDVTNPDSSIKGMANYMRDLMAEFKDPIVAAGAYNAGPGRMRNHLETGAPLPAETVNHMRKVAKAYYKYSGDARVLTNPHVSRSGTAFQAANMAATFEGMDTSAGPENGKKACVYAINKVLRASGITPPWGNDLYVPTVKANLDANAKRITGPVPGAIVIMQDNGTPPYPHIGIVGNDGLIISNSTSARKFNWKMTPKEYEEYYGKPNLYYRLN